MSEDRAHKAPQKKRTSSRKRTVTPERIGQGQDWIGAPPAQHGSTYGAQQAAGELNSPDQPRGQPARGAQAEPINKSTASLRKTTGIISRARSALERVCSSLTIKEVGRELLEYSPGISHLFRANNHVLQNCAELCRCSTSGKISPDALSKLLELVNRLYDAPVLPARRDLAVEHFLSAATEALSADREADLTEIELSRHLLLRNYPDRAAEFLVSVLTSRLVNTEELAIRAFKFDQKRCQNTVRVLRQALEPQARLQNKNNIPDPNYFSHLFRSVAINAVLQSKNPGTRYACKQGQHFTYQVKEEEVRAGVFRIISSAARIFPGLSHDEIAWINRQFAGQQISEYLPERLVY